MASKHGDLPHRITGLDRLQRHICCAHFRRNRACVFRLHLPQDSHELRRVVSMLCPMFLRLFRFLCSLIIVGELSTRRFLRHDRLEERIAHAAYLKRSQAQLERLPSALPSPHGEPASRRPRRNPLPCLRSSAPLPRTAATTFTTVFALRCVLGPPFSAPRTLIASVSLAPVALRTSLFLPSLLSFSSRPTRTTLTVSPFPIAVLFSRAVVLRLSRPALLLRALISRPVMMRGLPPTVVSALPRRPGRALDVRDHDPFAIAHRRGVGTRRTPRASTRILHGFRKIVSSSREFRLARTTSSALARAIFAHSRVRAVSSRRRVDDATRRRARGVL